MPEHQTIEQKIQEWVVVNKKIGEKFMTKHVALREPRRTIGCRLKHMPCVRRKSTRNGFTVWERIC